VRTRILLALGFSGLLCLLGPLGATTCPAFVKPEYKGAESCKKCHLLQYETWRKSRMASSFEALKPCDLETEEGKRLAGRRKEGHLDPEKDYRKDPKCLKCHTTGYGEPGGYPAEVTEESRGLAAKREGVQCEACHGPGSLYIPFFAEKENEKYKRSEVQKLGLFLPNKDTCIRCHNRESPFAPEEFDFVELKKKGTHEHVRLRYDHDD